MERLTHRLGDIVVPTGFDIDFVLDVDDGVYKGFNDILKKLNSYESTDKTPEDIEGLKSGFDYLFAENAALKAKLAKAVRDVKKLLCCSENGQPINPCHYCSLSNLSEEECGCEMGDKWQWRGESEGQHADD